MDVLRVVQLFTDLAYLLLGVAAVAAAVRRPEPARRDVALLFGTLAVLVVLQEVPLLTCSMAPVCVIVPAGSQLSSILVLAIPYLLLRLVDDIAEVPPWGWWLTLVLFFGLASVVALAPASAPDWVSAVVSVYVVAGTVYAASVFIDRAHRNAGITSRRMAAVAWACCLVALTFVAGLAAVAAPWDAPFFISLSRITGLISGLCFWAGFFPPAWLSRAWRLPELLDYLRPTRLMAGTVQAGAPAADAIALERLTAAAAQTTGARRAFLILDDPVRGDLFVWGAPSARVSYDDPLVGAVFRSGEPRVERAVRPEWLAPAVGATFAIEALPSTAILVPIWFDRQPVGVLAAYADKGPMFVEDDLDVLRFFAGEAAAILQVRHFRESAQELAALREADRLKDEFMAVVSHELRTPLTAISGYADILLRKLSGPLNERQERQVGGIRDAARRLLALINDLLDVSKLEAGTLDLHLTRIDPRSAMLRAVASTRVIAAAKGVHLEIRESDVEPPPVMADEERLQQILTNLLINAIKFTPQDGWVWIDAIPGRDQARLEVVFRVEDTGVGLAPGQAERIWDRFYQAEASSTRRFGGAGLGLSIVRRLAELHGGRAEAVSAGLNKGSCFSVYLPAVGPHAIPEDRVGTPPAGQPVPSPPEREPHAAERGEMRLPAATAGGGAGPPLVLVVEDDQDIAAVLRTYLESEGYRVDVVADGLEAIQAARTLRPFAITLDISLPKLDGWSVLNALKREPATARIPVVVVSIVDNKDFGMVLGATDYLVKPIDHERLRGILRTLRQARQPGSGTVLVVDDDPALRDVLGSSLSEDGWLVTTASDGESALAVLDHNEPPAAMVLDLMMPRVDGFEVLRAVRSKPALRQLPVIVVTAKDLTEDDRRRLAGGAQRVILKQALRIDELQRQVRDVLATHRGRVDGGSNQRRP